MLNGGERLALQGGNINDLADVISTTPESTCWHLAGNAVNYYNMAVGLCAAFSCLKLDWLKSRDLGC